MQDQIDEIMRVFPKEPVLMRTDPPVHTRVRALVSRVLTPAEALKIESQIEELSRPWIARGQLSLSMN